MAILWIMATSQAPRPRSGSGHPSSVYLGLALLTVAAGLVDAVTVLTIQVFAANVTGNLAFLGFALAGPHHYAATPPCQP